VEERVAPEPEDAPEIEGVWEEEAPAVEEIPEDLDLAGPIPEHVVVEEAFLEDAVVEDTLVGEGLGEATDEEESGIPDGFETQILEGATPSHLTESPAEEESTQASSHEPKWLFSLLKKEGEREGER
jgi:hypothetical protein